MTGGDSRCSRNARCRRCLPARRRSGSRSNPCRARSFSAVAADAPSRSTAPRHRQARRGSPAGQPFSSRGGPSGWPKPAELVIARSPTAQRVAGSRHNLLASFTFSNRRAVRTPIGTANPPAVVLTGEPSEHRLAQRTRQPLATIFPSARQRERRHRVDQSQGAVQLAIGKQPSIGPDRRAAKLKHQAAGRNRASKRPYPLHPAGRHKMLNSNP